MEFLANERNSKMKKIAPLVMFVYNRPHLIEPVLEAINRNELADETEFYIFSDGAKKETEISKVEEVRASIKCFLKENNFRKVYLIESSKNKGLANSIIEGVSKIIEEYGRVIVLEDDLVTSPCFLRFMNDCLDYYEKNSDIWSIGGTTFDLPSLKEYKHDVYSCYRGVSWGWATWKDRWITVDWNVADYCEFMKDSKRKKMFKRGGQDMVNALRMQMEGKTNSWAIRWCYQQSKLNMLTILPKKTLIENIGWDGSGTHCGTENRYETKIDGEFTYCLENIGIDKRLMKEYRSYYSRPLLNRMLDYIYIKMKEIDIFRELIEQVSSRKKKKRKIK